MEKTPKYEFGKPDQNDFYDVDVFNNNMEKVETAMTEFDDTGTVAEIKSFPEMLTKLVTGNKLAVTLRNLKAGLQFVLHAGSIVNNCVTDNPNLPLSAAQGKALMDAVNVLNTKTIFAGSARSLHVRSGDNGIKNIYLDIHDADGKYASIAFLSDGEKAIKYSVNGNVMWRVSL